MSEIRRSNATATNSSSTSTMPNLVRSTPRFAVTAAGAARAEPIEPDPAAHAEVLVLTYGLQTAAWIAETNLATARRNDTPYWSRVLQTVTRLRDTQHKS